jgi:hypothetical protein
MTDELTAEQRRQAIALIEELPWGDVEAQIRDLEEALWRALEATCGDLLRWEARAEELGFQDEFSLSLEDVAALTPEWRLAYVARLVRSLALAYGVPERELGGSPSTLIEDPDSVAGLVRGINDLIHLPSAPRPSHSR